MAKQSTPFIILVDVDDTLVDARWREQFMPTRVDGGKVPRADWDLYNAKSIDDRPIEINVEIVNRLGGAGYELWFVTSRPQKWEALTRVKLEEIGVGEGRGFSIYMRPNDDSSPSPILKPSLVFNALKERFEESFSGKISDYVALAIDDRADVCEAYRALGIPCFLPILPEAAP